DFATALTRVVSFCRRMSSSRMTSSLLFAQSGLVAPGRHRAHVRAGCGLGGGAVGAFLAHLPLHHSLKSFVKSLQAAVGIAAIGAIGAVGMPGRVIGCRLHGHSTAFTGCCHKERSFLAATRARIPLMSAWRSSGAMRASAARSNSSS